MFGLFSKLLLMLDFLAPTMHLNVNGSWAVKTYTGFFISAICLGLVIYCTTLQVIDFFDTTSPFIAQELKLNTVYPSIDLISNKHVPLMFAFSGSTDTIKYEDLSSYFTFKFAQWIYTKPPDGSNVMGLEVLELPPVPCRDLIAKGMLDLKDYANLGAYMDLLPDYGICVDTSGFNLTVIGSNADQYQKFTILELYPCSLPDGVGCKSKEEVNALWIQIIKPVIGLNLGNQEKPLRYEVNADDYYALHTDLSQFYSQQLIVNTILDNRGFLFPTEEKATFTTYDPPLFTNQWRDGTQLVVTKDQINDLESISPYFSFQLGSGMKYNVIRRNYNSFLEYLGNIGGFNSLIMAGCFSIYYFWHFYQQKLAMVHAIYGLKQEKRSCCKKKVAPKPLTSQSELESKPTLGPLSTLEREQDGKIHRGTIYVSSSMIDHAWDHISGTLDLVTLCKEVNVVKYLSNILFKEYQKTLIPIATFSKQMEEKKRQEHAEQMKKNPIFGAIAKFTAELPLNEEERLEFGVHTLVKNVNEHVSRASTFLTKEGSPPHPDSDSKPVLDRLEAEINKKLLDSIKECSTLLEIPSLVPSMQLQSTPRLTDDKNSLAGGIESLLNGNNQMTPAPLVGNTTNRLSRAVRARKVVDNTHAIKTPHDRLPRK